MPAIARLHEFVARLFLSNPFGQVEPLHGSLHVLLGGLTQDYTIATRHPLAFALPHLFALDRHGLHAFGQRIGGEQRHRQRDHGRHGGNCGEDHRQQPGIVESVDEEFDHAAAQKSKLIILRMTSTPMAIHMRLAASIIRPIGVVQSSSM
jgi:hypothetical protein